MFSLDEVERALPPQLKGGITPGIVDSLNKAIHDPEFAESVRDNLIGMAHVLQQGRFKLESYFDAVMYVSYKLMGHSDRESYKRAFPDRWQALAARGASSSDIAAYVSMYNKNKLVNLIYEQTMIPIHVLNQDVRQKAINVQLELMLNAKSEKVRTDAANSLLTHLKPPETTKIDLQIGIKENSEVQSLKEQMIELANNQKSLIALGHTTQSIAHEKIITDADYAEVKP